jgi:outer membrane protein assembly factor BamB
MALLPSADAHDPSWDIPTFAYVTALPNPIGVNQATTIYMFLGNPPFPSSAMNNDYRFHNYQLGIVAPDGTITNQTWETVQDTTNSQYYSFTPDQVGTYNITFTFPGQEVNDYSHPADYTNDTFLPSQYTMQLVVQETPVTGFSANPLPTEYWTRPIYGTNSDWWSISSNWLGTGVTGYGSMPGPNEQMFSGDSIGPQTGHIMWTKSLQSGGVAGGDNFEIQGNQYFEGSAYNQRFTNPIIINGYLYYTEPVSYTGVASGNTVCVDLRTGQEVWSKAIPALSFGLVWDHEDPNQHGVYPAILATSNFAQLYDADTGTPLFNVTGVPSGTSVLGPNGEILRYVFVNLGTSGSPDYVLAQWNSSKLWSYIVNPYTNGMLLYPSIINATSATSQTLISTVPIPLTGTTGTSSSGSTVAVPYGSSLVVNGGVFNSSDAQNRYDWNYSVSWRNTMTSTPSILSVSPGNMLLCRNGSYPALGAYNPYTYFAVNLNASKGDIGKILWMKTIQPPTGKNITTITYAGVDFDSGVFVESYRQTMQFVGFDLNNGNKLWTSEPQGPMDYYGSQGPGTLANQIAYGKVYSAAYDGILYCYDIKTGETLWTYGNGGMGNSTDSGFEVPGRYPTFLNAVGNDVVYLLTSEHTVTTPVYKGALMRAVNATTGAEIWTLSNDNNEFLTTSFAMADGFAVTFNAYDNQIYSIGRGPSETTVQASPKVTTFGSNVVIEGTVTDISSGTTQNEQAARFPHGVPVSSDASMGEWMGYVYQQQPCPTNFEGVTVQLSVIDSNGNFRPIGTATTDASGAYSYVWNPDISGTYTVIATFAGTNGYWPSSQETAFNVMDAPAATATPTPAAPSMADLYFLPVSVAIIIAIVLIGAVLAIMIQKRP